MEVLLMLAAVVGGLYLVSNYFFSDDDDIEEIDAAQDSPIIAERENRIDRLTRQRDNLKLQYMQAHIENYISSDLSDVTTRIEDNEVIVRDIDTRVILLRLKLNNYDNFYSELNDHLETIVTNRDRLRITNRYSRHGDREIDSRGVELLHETAERLEEQEQEQEQTVERILNAEFQTATRFENLIRNTLPDEAPVNPNLNPIESLQDILGNVSPYLTEFSQETWDTLESLGVDVHALKNPPKKKPKFKNIVKEKSILVCGATGDNVTDPAIIKQAKWCTDCREAISKDTIDYNQGRCTSCNSSLHITKLPKKILKQYL